MRKVAFWGLSLLLIGALTAPGFAQDIKDRTEYDAYMAVFNEKTDFTKKAALADKFLNDYKDTTARTQTYMMLILSYAQIPNWAKALETADKQGTMAPNLSPADKNQVLLIGLTAAGQTKNNPKTIEYAEKILTVNPHDVNALVTLSGLLSTNFPTDEAARQAQLTKSLEVTKRALAEPKPAGVADPVWTNIQVQLHRSSCLVLLNQKKNADAIGSCDAALKLNKKDGGSWYLKGLAMKPGLVEAVNKYNAAIKNYNDNRDKDQITRDELKSVSDGAEKAAQTKKDELIDVFARAVASGGDAAGPARDELTKLITDAAELNKVVADKKAEMGN